MFQKVEQKQMFLFGQVQIGNEILGENLGDRSGYSTDISNDGTIVAIGAYRNDGNGQDSGHVRIYQNQMVSLKLQLPFYPGFQLHLETTNDHWETNEFQLFRNMESVCQCMEKELCCFHRYLLRIRRYSIQWNWWTLF